MMLWQFKYKPEVGDLIFFDYGSSRAIKIGVLIRETHKCSLISDYLNSIELPQYDDTVWEIFWIKNETGKPPFGYYTEKTLYSLMRDDSVYLYKKDKGEVIYENS